MMKYIIYSAVLLLNLFSLQSCLKEEENIFGKSSAERLIERGKEIDEILSSAPYGWYMNYYANTEEKMTGGYQILCKFERGKVTMAGAFTLANKYTIGSKHSSSYAIIESQGPVLSFSTYNPVIHSFGDPGSSLDIDGHAGDIEFVVTEASKDRVIMRGVKRNLRIELHALTEDLDWNKYCADVLVSQARMKTFSRFLMSESGKTVGMNTVISEDNELFNTEDIALEKRKYAVTNDGFDLYEPISIGNRKLSRFKWVEEEDKFVDKDKSNVEVKPVTLDYEQYLGTYEVTADNMDKPVTVTISELEKGKTLLVSEELLKYKFVITIDGAKLKINGQTLHVDDKGIYYKLGVYTTTDMIFLTSATYSFTQPLEGLWFSGSAEKPELKFFATSASALIFKTYAWGVRVVKYSKNSTSKDDIVGYDSLIFTNPVFKKL